MPSTVIKTFSYNKEKRCLEVIFTSGTIYQYIDVPEAEYESMRTSFAKGIYLNRHIKGKYKFERVQAD